MNKICTYQRHCIKDADPDEKRMHGVENEMTVRNCYNFSVHGGIFTEL
jgi:hypothetical protein